MIGIDVFSGDAFGTFELTAALEKVPYVPSYLGGLNIFEPDPVSVETVAIEKVESTLALIPTTQRGAPIPQQSRDNRDIRDFRTVRIAKGDSIRASEIQNIRAFGSTTELQQVQDLTMRRMVKLRRDQDLTHEYHRLGAIQGIVLDADGTSVIRNWFTEWGISQPAEVDWDLDNGSPASGAVKKLCNATIRAMKRASKGAWTPATQIIGLCGDAFYDDLTTHTEVVKTFQNQQAANELREGYANVFESFRYGQITWVNYQGTDDNSTVAVGTDKVKFFPVNAPGVFRKAMSPGESFELVNTPGKDIYARVIPDEKRNEYVEIEVMSYPLYICTRPEMLLRGRRT